MSDLQSSLRSLAEGGFYNEERHVRPDLFDEVARDLGQAFARRGRGGPGVSANQLRGFYAEVKALEIKLQEMTQSRGESGPISAQVYAENEYLVRMIGPKVAYIQGKQTGGNVSEEFKDYIEKSLGHVRSGKDFEVFMRLFESVVGFFYGYGGGRNR